MKMNLKHIKKVESRDDHYAIAHGEKEPYSFLKLEKKDLHPSDAAMLDAMCKGGSVKGYDEGTDAGGVKDPGPYGRWDSPALDKALADAPNNARKAQIALDFAAHTNSGDDEELMLKAHDYFRKMADPPDSARPGGVAPTPVTADSVPATSPAPAEMDIDYQPPPVAATLPPTPAPQMAEGPTGTPGSPALVPPLGTTLQSIVDAVANARTGNPQAAAANEAGNDAYQAAIAAGKTPEAALSASQNAVAALTASTNPQPPTTDAPATTEPSPSDPLYQLWMQQTGGGANLTPIKTGKLIEPKFNNEEMQKAGSAIDTALGKASERDSAGNVIKPGTGWIGAEETLRDRQNDLSTKIADIDADKTQWLMNAADRLRTQEENHQAESEKLFQSVKNAKVDPDVYWHSMGDGGRAATAIGLVINAFTSGWARQPNAALEMFNRNVDNAIRAQEFNLNKQMGLLNYHLAQGRDMRDAALLAKSNYLDIAAGQLAATTAAAAPGINSAQTQQAIADMRVKAQTLRSQAMLNEMHLQLDPQLLKANTQKANAEAQQALMQYQYQKMMQNYMMGALDGKGGNPVDAMARVQSIGKLRDPTGDFTVEVHEPQRDPSGKWQSDENGNGNINYRRQPKLLIGPDNKPILYQGKLQQDPNAPFPHALLIDKGDKGKYIEADSSLQTLRSSAASFDKKLTGMKNPLESLLPAQAQTMDSLKGQMESLLTHGEIDTTRLSKVDLEKANSMLAKIDPYHMTVGQARAATDQFELYIDRLHLANLSRLEGGTQ